MNTPTVVKNRLADSLNEALHAFTTTHVLNAVQIALIEYRIEQEHTNPKRALELYEVVRRLDNAIDFAANKNL